MGHALLGNPMSDHKITASEPRVYEYHDGDGNVYYSLFKAPNILSPPTRLKLRHRVGVHLINFLTQLRHTADDWEPDEGKVAATLATPESEQT